MAHEEFPEQSAAVILNHDGYRPLVDGKITLRIPVVSHGLQDEFEQSDAVLPGGSGRLCPGSGENGYTAVSRVK